ncbi:OPT/YSL family transporter, partial [Streptococcus pneumoniae]|uniref:OPT/YSL family transporter n=1 Tax=Streptococcus pneumoniae TaxID=1313 RepID=UPI001CBD5467
LRTLSPFYVSPSNYYDRFFLGLTNIGVTDDNEYDINAAGRLAYIVEAALSAAGALWVVFI